MPLLPERGNAEEATTVSKRRRFGGTGDEAGIDGADMVVRLRAGRIGRAALAKAVARVTEK